MQSNMLSLTVIALGLRFALRLLFERLMLRTERGAWALVCAALSIVSDIFFLNMRAVRISFSRMQA
ncbi:hypothetical protein XACN24_08850 [Xanthomonas albilineans]|uniref:hypothetical protein n=1 Tax=Xanthomonas albilineans TaxID=29447 RepID=UPI0003134B7F|nr:hypothetical protein [Xanthomonas albilineans]QHQ28548.1 hypothetical protein XaFJ1_GM001809 [Xanthomonas albilineans]